MPTASRPACRPCATPRRVGDDAEWQRFGCQAKDMEGRARALRSVVEVAADAYAAVPDRRWNADQGPFVVGRYRTVAEMELALGDKVALLHMKNPAT